MEIKYSNLDKQIHNANVYRTYPIIKFNKNIKHGYDELIHKEGPYDFFITIEFDYPCSDVDAIKAISFLFKAVQRDLFPRKEINQNSTFSGFSIAERHTKSTIKENCFHFHSLIKVSHKYIDKISLNKLEKSFQKNAKKVVLDNYNSNYEKIHLLESKYAIDIKKVNSAEVESYCTKKLQVVWSQKNTQIGFIDAYGVHNFSAINNAKYYN
jgi:hypothetical protein